LVDSGKGHWIKTWNYMFEAKGKGHMQMYWVEPSSSQENNNNNNKTTTSDRTANATNTTDTVMIAIGQTRMRSIKI